ncbi:MAG TPA: hypothetical protein VKE74_21155 [Gemmataceae bacterium]|nr:hypothetical protein [Gemmataceae bacterium]
MTRMLLIGLVGCALGLCASGRPADPPVSPPPADPAPSAKPPFHKELKDVAATYLKWGRVDNEARWAPELCRAPRPAQARFSASADEKTHGKKLYSLFAKDRNGYVLVAKEKTVKVGQVVVKQSWVPEEMTGTDAAEVRAGQAKLEAQPGAGPWDSFNPYVVRDGKIYKAAKQADLFVMMKLDPSTPETDEGWVYGTLTPDGKTVTAAGKLESCMKCHVEAKTDRLFGLQANDTPKP